MRAKSRSDGLDRNGYAPSILQDDMEHCFLCGRCDRKLDRHEIFPGTAYREKSKRYGLWVLLCNQPCHEGKDGAQYNRGIRERLSAYAQRLAMEEYGWTVEEFRAEFGKNWI